MLKNMNFFPSINEIDYLVGLAYENCQDKYFQPFVYKCFCDIKFINETNIQKSCFTG